MSTKISRINIILCCLFCLSFPCFAKAQSERDSVAVYGNVMDSFTYEILKGVHVEIMHTDSTLIMEFDANDVYQFYGYAHNIDRVGYLYIPRTSCIFRFSKAGYFTKCHNLRKSDIKRREKRMSIGEILLKKVPRGNERELREVTVTASKIRMVVKGDTLVYNADAFQLAQGSMLDGLIKMLPGFELQNGQIRVNGEYVSSLLVNGEDFFRGDPSVALENLPAYMVDKVKVYRKEHEYSYITKECDKNDLPLVVDVNLKREYSIGWVANASAGYGLENRYLARLFALRFTDNSRLAVYGNANNVNDTREPGTSGNWTPQAAASGRTEMQTGGFEALIKDKKGVWKYVGNAKVFRQENDNRSIASTETFQPTLSGNTFARLRNENTGRHFKLQTSHEYTHRKQSNFVTLKAAGAYHKERTWVDAMRAEFSGDPKDSYRAASLDSLFFHSSDRLTAMLVNRQRNLQKQKSEAWNGTVSANSFLTIPHTPDYLNLSAAVSVEKQEATTFSDYSLLYGAAAGSSTAEDKRKRYATAPMFDLTANLKAEYTYRADWAHLSPYYRLEDKYQDADRNFYRLDFLGEDAPAFGTLPSTTAALMSYIDAPNTYTSQHNVLSQKFGANWYIWLPGNLPSHRIQLKPELTWRTDRLTYHRDVLDTKTHRGKVAFTPTASWGFENCYLTYSLDYSFPDMLSLLDYTDTSDPLNIYKGNGSLKRSAIHLLNFRRSFSNYKTGWHFYINADWSMTRNAIAHAMIYDATTGVRTYMPRNVDGNWLAKINLDYKQPLDKKKNTFLSSVTDVGYRNSVDYVTERSSVRSLNVSETLRLNTRIKKYILDFSVGAKYLHAESPRANFREINSFDFRYGATAQIPLPAGFNFSTDLNLYHRTGYSDASMNECFFVANARLNKSLLKGRLGLMLDGFDIFHGLSNVTRVINAQGITETWYNSLPSYAMLTVTYKFNKPPKKK